MKYDYLIVGAGLYGAAFAQQMTAAGKRCLVIDRRSHLAGNAHCQEVEGILVHAYGAHIFHTADEEVWEYVNRYGKFNHYVNSPVAIYHNELYNLPFNMNTFSKLWGVLTPGEAQAEIQRQASRHAIDEPQNLEEQALKLVGDDIYQKLIKGYTEKQWGRDCKDLPAFILRRVPLRFTYDNNYFTDPHQGIPTEGLRRAGPAAAGGQRRAAFHLLPGLCGKASPHRPQDRVHRHHRWVFRLLLRPPGVPLPAL